MERFRRSDWKERRAPLKTREIVRHQAEHASVAQDAKLRLAEREALDRLDTRTAADIWLGDPPCWQSALAQAKPEHVAPAMLIGAAIGGALRMILGEPDAKMRRAAEAQKGLTPGQAPSPPSNLVKSPRYVRQNGPNRALTDA
jgi:hypothetical protein